ncbi:LOW QUALITY PROTEIN: hypothetical protein TorRG33x02_107770 [Trema orientale]|uniref:Uncharacterized protein n=1 Tax=Trema orientale TaxID=63057 RepID=A0A2P5F6V3_TREOI|nr:LOW QUALITY PROTEIN: hypothetical protein TorRG33x02_107770 [Trema orientale]
MELTVKEERFQTFLDSHKPLFVLIQLLMKLFHFIFDKFNATLASLSSHAQYLNAALIPI